MKESSLILLLKKFDRQMLKDFSAFIKSPFFNTNKSLINLYEYIRKQYPDFSSEKLEKKYIYRKVLGKNAYNDGFLRVLMSNLQSLAEEYLVYRGIEKDPLIKKKYLLDQLSSLGERKISEKIIKQELKKFEGIVPKGPDDFLGMYYVVFYKKYFYSTQFQVKKGNKPEESLYEEQKYLIYHFLLRTLANYFYHLNQMQVINYSPRLIFLEEIILFLEKHPEFLELPMLNITYLRVLLLKNNDINDYYRLKKAFYGTFTELDTKDAFNTISIIINYCQKNYFLTDDEVFLREKFEILKFAVDNNLNTFEESEGFDPGRFLNIVNTAVDFGEIQWVQEFIAAFGNELKDGSKDFLIAFGKALVHFANKQYDESLLILSRLKNPSITTYKFALRVLYLKAYFEKNYIDQAESAADSFRHLVHNDKLITEQYRESHRNFYYVFTKLLALKNKKDAETINELKKTAAETRPLIQKKWIYQKLREF